MAHKGIPRGGPPCDIVPDFVHVLVNGRIVKSGGKELAIELENKGYEWVEKTTKELQHA